VGWWDESNKALLLQKSFSNMNRHIKQKNEKQWVRDHQTKMKGKSKNKYNMSIITYEKGQI